MTTDELRLLADEATPGPWRWTPEDAARVWQPTQHMLSGIGYHCIAEANDPASRKNAVNARLISLAPDLARLCAELGEALYDIADPGPKLMFPESKPGDWARNRAIRALAKLSDLKSVT